MLQLLMPSRYYLRNFVPPYHYHIYNRGANKQNIFRDATDYTTFLDIIAFYLKFPNGRPFKYIEKLTNKARFQVRNLEDVGNTSFSITCFCLMPNHFHFLIKQNRQANAGNSITNFMRRTMIAYSMYFNQRHDHSGTIFQGRYKNIVAKSDEQLLHLTKYIHNNPVEILESKKLSTYKYSSYPDYLGANNFPWTDKEEILKYFSQSIPNLNYQRFCEDGETTRDKIEAVALDLPGS